METGYLECRPAPFWHKAEHSSVSNIMKMMFFYHLYAVTAAQVLASQLDCTYGSKLMMSAMYSLQRWISAGSSCHISVVFTNHSSSSNS